MIFDGANFWNKRYFSSSCKQLHFLFTFLYSFLIFYFFLLKKKSKIAVDKIKIKYSLKIKDNKNYNNFLLQNPAMSFNKNLSIRRKQKDIFKLRNSNIKVTPTDKQSTYEIQFKGSLYSLSKAPSRRRMKKGSGELICTCLNSTHTKALQWGS